MNLAFAVFGVHTLFYDGVMNADFAADPASDPSGGAVAVSRGEFHPGAGRATVYRLEDGSYALRLEDLDIFNGPDLYVYAAGDATDDEAVQENGFFNVGWLNGKRGDQTYALPKTFDPEAHRAISVWCRRFSVNFATAPLREGWPAIIRRGTGKAGFGWRRSWS
jgi:hypothetical protein